MTDEEIAAWFHCHHAPHREKKKERRICRVMERGRRRLGSRFAERVSSFLKRKLHHGQSSGQTITRSARRTSPVEISGPGRARYWRFLLETIDAILANQEKTRTNETEAKVLSLPEVIRNPSRFGRGDV